MTDQVRECDLSLSLPSCHGFKMENLKTCKNIFFLSIKGIYFLLLIYEKKFFLTFVILRKQPGLPWWSSG